MMNKKGIGALTWIIIVLILVAIVAYFAMSGDGSGAIIGGNSIPQPPALPK